jgi:arylsulfatase A-like enzyme
MLFIPGRWMKKIWHEQSSGIPLLMRYKDNFNKGMVCDRVVGLIDVTPAVFALAGLDVPADRHGYDRTEKLAGRYYDRPNFP